jgi:hypothetical protein
MERKICVFTENGGMPFNQQTLQYMQENYLGLSDIVAKIVNHDCVISGVEQTGYGMWTDGWVVCNGELLPFAGAAGEWFKIVEQKISLIFNDGSSKPVILNKYATASNEDILNIFMRKQWSIWKPDLTGTSYVSPFPRLRSFKSIWDMLDAYRGSILDIRKYKPFLSRKIDSIWSTTQFTFGGVGISSVSSVRIEATVHAYNPAAGTYLNVSNRITKVMYRAEYDYVDIYVDNSGILEEDFPKKVCEIRIYSL